MRDLISKGLLTAAAATSVLSMSGYAHAAGADGTAAGSPGVLSGNTIQVPLDIPVNVCGNSANVVGAGNPVFGNNCVNTSTGAQHSHAGHSEQASDSTHATRPAQPPQSGSAVHQAPAHAPEHASSPGYGESPAHQGSQSHTSEHHAPQHHSSAHHTGHGAQADGAMVGSPGVGSGNGVLAPLHIPVNLCGNTVDVIGLLNPVFGNTCASHAPEATSIHRTPPRPHAPQPPVPGEDRAIPPAPSHTPNDPKTQLPVVKPVTAAPADRTELAQTGVDLNLFMGAGMSAALMIGGGILYRRSSARRF